MITQEAETAQVNRIRWKGKTYLLSQEDLALVFEVYGKATLGCEFGACPHVELVPSGFPNGFNQRCIYKPREDLEWEVSNSAKGEFSPRDDVRCAAIEDKIVKYIAAGYLDEFMQ